MSSLTAVLICNEDSETICKSLTSYFANFYKDSRLIVVDNASKDGSYDKIINYINPLQLSEDLGTDEPEKIAFAKVGSIPVVAIKFKKKRNIPVLLNYAINTTKQDTQFYLFFQRSELIGDFPRLAADILKYNPAVGIVYSDFQYNNTTSLFKSFERNDILTMLVPDNFACQAHLFGEAAFDESLATGYNTDFFVKTSQQNLLTHIPEPLFKSYDKKHESIIKHNHTSSGIWV